MPPGRQWVFAPGSGGKTIPAAVRARTEGRLRRYGEQHFAGRYARLGIRFRGQFCYIDAYEEPVPPALDWPPAEWQESREEALERIRNTPIHMCRLRYFGDEERWGFAFFGYSDEQYQLSAFPSGELLGPPEEAFRVSAEAYFPPPKAE